MSTIKLNGSSSGNAQITVAAAAGTPTITLPTTSINLATAGSDGQFLKTNGSGTLSFADAGGGITHGVTWRVNSSFTGDAEPIASNWEKADGVGQGELVDSSTWSAPSSGVFSFPKTGYWLVSFGAHHSSQGSSLYNQAMIFGTTNNGSAWTTVMKAASDIGFSNSNWVHGGEFGQTIMDVTDIAQVKVKFHVLVEYDSTSTNCSSSWNATYANFIRLGDT